VTVAATAADKRPENKSIDPKKQREYNSLMEGKNFNNNLETTSDAKRHQGLVTGVRKAKPIRLFISSVKA